jgi:truncated hemoglobin YjbI
MIQEIYDYATKNSGVNFEEATEIDNLKITIDDSVIFRLVENFYGRIYTDHGSKEFHDRFEKIDRSDSIVNLHEYLCQRLGLDNTYTERKGFPHLLSIHGQMNISRPDAVRWLQHMEDALDDFESEIDDNTRSKMLDYFTFTAFTFVGSSIFTNRLKSAGVSDDIF